MNQRLDTTPANDNADWAMDPRLALAAMRKSYASGKALLRRPGSVESDIALHDLNRQILAQIRRLWKELGEQGDPHLPGRPHGTA